MPIPSLTLLTTAHCHLCSHGREVLEEIRLETGLDWTEVPEETSQGSRLAEGAPPLRPLLFSSEGKLLAAGRLSAKRLRRDLDGNQPTAAAGSANG